VLNIEMRALGCGLLFHAYMLFGVGGGVMAGGVWVDFLDHVLLRFVTTVCTHVLNLVTTNGKLLHNFMSSLHRDFLLINDMTFSAT
jgi:hypothetical protein